jgi:hypothetical protein
MGGILMAKSKNKAFAVHPGEILKTEFMEPMGVSGYTLAKALAFPRHLRGGAWRARHQRRHCHPAGQVFWLAGAVCGWK